MKPEGSVHTLKAESRFVSQESAQKAWCCWYKSSFCYMSLSVIAVWRGGSGYMECGGSVK